MRRTTKETDLLRAAGDSSPDGRPPVPSIPKDTDDVPRVCTSFRHIPGKSKTERCGRPATFRLPNYFTYAAKGHRDAYSCDDCARRQRMQGMQTRPLR